jgi:hypothetical protein
MAICEERDDKIRNASHHRWFVLDKATQIVRERRALRTDDLVSWLFGAVRSPILASDDTPAAGTDDFEYNGHKLSRLKDCLFVLSEPEHAARRRAYRVIRARIEAASAIASNSVSIGRE